MRRPHLAAIDYRITPENWSGRGFAMFPWQSSWRGCWLEVEIRPRRARR